MIPDILIVRHGETQWNVEKRMQGAMDSPLTDRGIAQARNVRQILFELDLTGWQVRCSPQPRAVHTAAIVFEGTSHHIATTAALCEINVGSWAGLSKSEIESLTGPKPPDSGFLDHYDRSPGETFAMLRARCVAFLNTLEMPTILVTHGITSRMLRVAALGLPTSDVSHVPGGQGIVHGVIGGRAKTYGKPQFTGDPT